jgi:hypothetical protein
MLCMSSALIMSRSACKICNSLSIDVAQVAYMRKLRLLKMVSLLVAQSELCILS